MISVKIAHSAFEIESCMEIRRIVFMVEQHISHEDEYDGWDVSCTHFMAHVDTANSAEAIEAIGTARLKMSDDGDAKAQRVAVLKEWRGRGVGAALMHALEQEAQHRGARRMILDAQNSAIPFYESLSYRVDGEEFMDAGIPHHMMFKTLV